MTTAWDLRLVGLATLAALAGVCVAPAAAAGKKECAVAYVEAQKLKAESSFVKSREQLILCAKDECLAAVKKDCVAWLDEVNASIPSFVIEAKGPDGKETFDVKVSVDGEVVAEKLDVKAIEVDPGTHKLVLEYAGEAPVEQELILRQGQKNKVIEVSFAKKTAAKPDAVAEPDPTPEPDPKLDTSKKPPTLSYVLGGVGLVALVGTTYFWLGASSAEKDLEDKKCEPNCDQADVDSIKSKRLIGDIALGVGAACIGAAAYLWLAPKKSSAPKEAAALDVRVGPGGAWAGYSGSF
ncbi:MAG: hypothetical protein IPI67_09725 [Myxococcales bacterium]|nr:hypothetical protein [Myxococcales bacterium]